MNFLLIIKYLDVIVDLVNKIDSLVPEGTPGKSKAAQIIMLINLMDDKTTKLNPVLEKAVEWAYQLWVAPKKAVEQVTDPAKK